MPFRLCVATDPSDPMMTCGLPMNERPLATSRVTKDVTKKRMRRIKEVHLCAVIFIAATIAFLALGKYSGKDVTKLQPERFSTDALHVLLSACAFW